MRQDDYEIILSCIQHGAPALYTRLVTSLNKVIESDNRLAELKRIEADKARKAEAEKAIKKTTRVPKVKKVEAEQLSLPLD